MAEQMELKKLWSSKKLDASSVYITSPKVISESMTVPSEIDGKKVAAIGPGAFSPRCNKVLSSTKMRTLETVRHIVIPDSVTIIDDDAFRACVGLEQIEIPESVTQWGRQVFDSCVRLKEVRLPSSTTIIPNGMFYGCSGLERIVIPEKVKVIGSTAFMFCDKLREIVISEEQIKGFGYAMLESSYILDCFLKQIQGGKSDFGPEAYACITKYVQAEKKRQTELILSGNQTAIEAVLARTKKLTLQRLDEYLELAQKNNLTTVVALLLQIKQQRFSQKAISDQGDKQMGLAERTKAEWKQLFRYAKKDGGIVISGYKGLSPNLTIPGEMEELPVTQLKDKAFRRSLSGQNEIVELETVTIQPGLERIGKKAFANQRKLKEVHIPESVTFIASDAFDDEDEWNPIFDLRICAPAGSYAESYAKEKNIAFVAQ